MENVKLINRAASSIGYTAYTGQNRYFQPAGVKGDTLLVPKEEVLQLSYTKGGDILLREYLKLEETVREELNIETELEYDFSLEDIVRSLKEDNVEELREHLEYAPQGVVDLYLKTAVDLKLDSHEKRELIQEITGFNVNGAIELASAIEAPVVEEKVAPVKKATRTRAPRKAK